MGVVIVVHSLFPLVVPLGVENVDLVGVETIAFLSGSSCCWMFALTASLCTDLLGSCTGIVLLLDAMGLSFTKFVYLLQAFVGCVPVLQNLHHVDA